MTDLEGGASTSRPVATSASNRRRQEARMTTPAVVLALVCSSLPAWALVPGGGSAHSDCYVEWQVTSPDVGANRGRTGIDCPDGDPARGVDGVPNGRGVRGASGCAFQGNTPRR